MRTIDDCRGPFPDVPLVDDRTSVSTPLAFVAAPEAGENLSDAPPVAERLTASPARALPYRSLTTIVSVLCSAPLTNVNALAEIEDVDDEAS